MARKGQLTTASPLQYSEYERLLTKLHKDKNYFMELYARLSFCTGCRASDVLKLKWEDVLGSNYAMVTEKKTGKTRKITFSPSVQNKIDELYLDMKRPDTKAYIFANEKTGSPVTIQYINKELKKLKDKYRVKVDNFSTHTFRKTFGRYVYETNNKSAESLILLNKIFKHSSIEITKTYIGITEDEINGIYNSIQW